MNKTIQQFVSPLLSTPSIFTTAKSFRDNPVIGSPTLNKLGLHMLRLYLAHGMMRLRMWMLSIPVSKTERNFYFSEGYLLKENFLDEDTFAQLEQEVRQFNGDVREARQGNTLTHRAALSPDVLAQQPNLKRFLNTPAFKRLMRFTSGHFRTPLFYIENVINDIDQSGNDPQKIFHCDTFHPCMKCWFFLEDVEVGYGSFTYIPQSHRLSKQRRNFQYQMSQTAKHAENRLHARGSTRFTAEDIQELALPSPKEFAVKKNTLLIANVFGIHRRGDATASCSRLSIWGDSRTNPFIPLPGLGGNTINQIQHYFLQRFRDYHDNKAKREGRRSPWALMKARQNPFSQD